MARLLEAHFHWAGGTRLSQSNQRFPHPAHRKVGRVLLFMPMHPTSLVPGNESLWTTLRSFPRPVWILFAGVFLNKFGTFVVPFLALYLTRRGFTTGDAALAIGAYGLGRLGATFIGGHLAD